MKQVLRIAVIVYIISGSFDAAFSQCIENSHSPFANQSWLSCNQSEGPITDRGITHWLLYDLGYDYSIDSIFIWNYNEWSNTGNGAKDIMIDYSLDQIEWTSLGSFELSKAPGSWKYNSPDSLEVNIDFARFVLITVVSSWDEQATCAGIAEIKMNVSQISATDDLLVESDISLFPNPAIDKLELKVPIELVNYNIKIYNSVGQVILNRQIQNSNNVFIDINTYESGLYYLQIEHKEGILSKGFVKTDI